MFRSATFLLLLTCVLGARAWSQDSDSEDKKIDVHTPAVSFHIGDDADAKRIGLPLYPGARLKAEGDDKDHANLSLLTDAFGMKLIVANYVSDDAPAQILDFYRGKLKKYGKVLECHSHGGDVNLHQDSKDSADATAGRALKCDDDSGPTVELKVGTEDNQRVVAVEPGEGGKGSKLALLYIYTRGKRGDI